ncbi:unannotated protein [freshwater metagenome]|uniref:Unannotated protein n=1 Tax=freshwater metagenome TaxID=449393 RepID=A0A6J6CWP1_9ZZZZ
MADAMAAAISASFASATSLVATPRAGSKTGAVRPDVETCSALSIQCPTMGRADMVILTGFVGVVKRLIKKERRAGG